MLSMNCKMPNLPAIAITNERTSGTVHYLPQRHASPEGIMPGDTAMMQSVVASQRSIFDVLEAHRAEHVFVEAMSSSKSENPTALRRNEIASLVAAKFANYQPNKPLSAGCRKLLHEQGGALVYAALHRTVHLHPTMTEKTAGALAIALARRQELLTPIAKLRAENFSDIAQLEVKFRTKAIDPHLKVRLLRLLDTSLHVRNQQIVARKHVYSVKKPQLDRVIITSRDSDCAKLVTTFVREHPKVDVFIVMGARHRVPERIHQIDPTTPVVVYSTAL